MTTTLNIAGRTGILHQFIAELRYADGYIYLDKCGRVLSGILYERENWLVKGDPNPNATRVVNPSLGLTFNFSASKLDFSYERQLGSEPPSEVEIAEIMAEINEVTALVVDQLGLKRFERLGFRQYYMILTEEEDQAKEFLFSLNMFTVNPKIVAEIGKPTAGTIALFVEHEGIKRRIATSLAETQARVNFGNEILGIPAAALSKDQNKTFIAQLKQKRKLALAPQSAVMIDVDSFIETGISPSMLSKFFSEQFKVVPAMISKIVG